LAQSNKSDVGPKRLRSGTANGQRRDAPGSQIDRALTLRTLRSGKARHARHGRQRGRQYRGAPRDDRGPDSQAAGNGEVKDKKFGATAAGTVYRRTSKRRV
jgi:hypothetical protein